MSHEKNDLFLLILVSLTITVRVCEWMSQFIMTCSLLHGSVIHLKATLALTTLVIITLFVDIKYNNALV